jgi:putative transposase
MPRDLIRYQQTGFHAHFITFSCHGREPYLRAPDVCDQFERSLEAIRQRYDLLIYGYVVMPEHIHLLASEPKRAILAKVIQALKLSVAVKQTQRPFWLKRYYDFNVYTESKRVEKLRYIHRNPVTRGLVTSPEDWKWSSFRQWWTGESGIVQVETDWTANRRMRAAFETHVSESRHGAPASEAD